MPLEFSEVVSDHGCPCKGGVSSLLFSASDERVRVFAILWGKECGVGGGCKLSLAQLSRFEFSVFGKALGGLANGAADWKAVRLDVS